MARLHPPLDAGRLVCRSIIDDALRTEPHAVRPVETHMGNVAHVLAREDVAYVPGLGLQIVDGHVVPAEGIVDPWNLGHLLRVIGSDDAPPEAAAYFTSAFPTRYVDEEVCVVSNMFSINFSHFTEELLKVLILERAGYSGPYVYTHLPPFAFPFWDALGLDRRRLVQVPYEPATFRSALYTTNLSFVDLSRCPDIFFELRERMFSAAGGMASPFGERLWLDRGATVIDSEERDLVNSDEVDEWLEGYGFTRLDIGSLPLLEQIAASRDADVIAGPHGSAFLHCMYMKPQSNVIEIFSPYYLNGYSFEICRVLRHRYAMIVDYNAPHAPYPYGRRIHVPRDQLRLALQNIPSR